MKWINTIENLPKDGEEVLVCDEDYDVWICTFDSAQNLFVFKLHPALVEALERQHSNKSCQGCQLVIPPEYIVCWAQIEKPDFVGVG